jgi:hypothetical protein
VIGSKPEPVFPDSEPHKVYTANGALALAQRYCDRPQTEVIALISKNFFKSSEKYRNHPTALILRGCRADKLWITGAGVPDHECDSPEQRGIRVDSIGRLTRFRSLVLKLQFASLFRLLKNVDTGSEKQKNMPLLKKIVETRSIPSLGISTGMLALLMALNDHRMHPTAKIYVVGIGLDSAGNHFYNSKQQNRPHLEPDRYMLLDIAASEYARRVVFTDPKLKLFFEKPG